MAGIKERLIQVILRGKDLLSPEAKKSRGALDDLRNAGEKLREELDKSKEQNNLVHSLTALEKESERAERTAERTTKQAADLRAELDKSPDSKGLSRSLTIAEREAAKAQLALDKLKQEAVDYATKAKAAGIDTGKLSDEEKRLAAELDKAKRSVDSNTRATKNLEREQRQAARSAAEQGARTTSLGNALKSAEKKVLGYAAAYISLRAATNLASKALGLVRAGIEGVISVGDDSEKAKIQLEGLMGSIAGGEQATAWIEEFADKSGQRINDVLEAFAELKAYGLDPMDGSMQAIMDKTAQLGGEQEKLKGISLAIGQMWAKEKIVQEEVNQLRERGVNAFDLLSKAMNKNVSELQDMAAAGQLGRNEIKLLIDEMGRSAEGQASRALETLSGKWNVLLNQFQKFGEEVASHGAMDIVKEKLQGVLDKVIELTDDGTLDNFAESLSAAFVVGVEKVEEYVQSLANVDFKQLIDGSSEWLSDFGTKIDSAVEKADTAGRIFTGVWHGFRALVTSAATALVAAVNTTVGNLMRAAAAVADAIGLDDLAGKAKFAYGFLDELQTAFADATIDSAGKVADAIEGSSQRAIDSKKAEQAEFDAAAIARKNELTLAQAYADQWVSAHKSVGDEARKAAVDGVRALEDMADALNVIDSTESVEELERLRKALLKAYQEGSISQQEFEQGTGVLNGKIKTLGKTAEGAAKDFKTLDGVMDAIAKAANNIDTRAAQAALDKLYREGKINALEHAKAQEELNKKVAALKPAAEASTKAVKEQGKALDEATGSAAGAARSVGDVGDKAGRASASMEWFTGIINQAREPLEQMSDAARDAFNELQGITTPPELDMSSLSGTTDALKRAKIEAYELDMAMSGLYGANMSDSLSRWATMTKQRGKSVEVSFLEQKAALQQLQESYESGEMSVTAFAAAADDARKRFNLLDESDLSALEGAVDAAKQKMDQLAGSTKSTLESLNDELLQLKGTQEEIEKSKMDSRRRDLQAQLADARKDGDDRAVRNLQQALSTLSEIESERERAERNKKADEAKAEAEKAATAKAPPTQKQEPTKVIKLQVGSQSVDVGVDSSRDEAALLSILEQAGLRSM